MPQQGGDLVSAGYPTSRPLTALLGGLTQNQQPNVPVRSNLEFISGGVVDAVTSGIWGGSAGSIGLMTAVPVVPGDVISRVGGFLGATAEAACVSHMYAALYSGVWTSTGSPTLIGQTVDYTASAPGVANFMGTASPYTSASLVPWSASFATPQTITSVNAPYGFIYVAQVIYHSASPSSQLAINTGASFARTGAMATQLFGGTTGPLHYGAYNFTGPTASATAPATLVGATTWTYAPIVVLS